MKQKKDVMHMLRKVFCLPLIPTLVIAISSFTLVALVLSGKIEEGIFLI